MTNGQTKSNYEDADDIYFDVAICLECISINAALTPNRKHRYQVAFCWLSLTMKIYIVIPTDQYDHRNFKLTTGAKSIYGALKRKLELF